MLYLTTHDHLTYATQCRIAHAFISMDAHLYMTMLALLDERPSKALRPAMRELLTEAGLPRRWADHITRSDWKDQYVASGRAG